MKEMSFLKISYFLIPFLVAAPMAHAAEAVALIKGTSPDSKITGEAKFEETEGGLKITVTVNNAPPGEHGIHIHENGDCGNLGNAAGSHFNPDKVTHGYLPADGFAKAHAGDLGNIEISQEGKGKLETFVPGLTLTESKYAVAGKAVILHEKEDNFGQPTGNAGSRIACGVITEKAS